MTDGAVTIRTAGPNDVDTVRRVAAEAWRATYSGHIPDVDIEHFLDGAYSERNVTRNIATLGEGFLLAEREGEVVGYAMARINRDGEAELDAIYVLPAHHGVGAGRALWDAARDALAHQGYRRMCCWVLAENDRARRFYERQGAILTEEREFAIGATMIREARYCVGG